MIRDEEEEKLTIWERPHRRHIYIIVLVFIHRNDEKGISLTKEGRAGLTALAQTLQNKIDGPAFNCMNHNKTNENKYS